MLDRIAFVLGEAFQALRRNVWMTFAAVTTAATALFLLGGLIYGYLMINRAAEGLPSKIEVRVFLKEGLSEQQMKDAGAQIKAVPGVKSAVWISKADSWKAYQKRFPESLVTAVENPLPHMFEVQLSDIAKTDSVAKAIQAMPAVEPLGVKYRKDAQELVVNSLRQLRIIGYGLGALMLLTSGILIYNTIRLTVVARHREIRIMRLVGASRVTVIMPMLIEGAIQGALGGVVGAGLLFAADGGFRSFLGTIATGWPVFPLTLFAGYLALLGAGYGLICSLWALRDMRKAR